MSEGSRADGVDDGGDGGGTPEVGSGPGPGPADQGSGPLLEQDQNATAFDQQAAAAAAGDNPGADSGTEFDPDREGYDADMPDGSDYSQ
jgi:hypothetical protein